MSQMPADWIAFFFFLVLCVAAAVAEVMWLTRNGWTTSGKAIAFVLLTDIFGLGVGSFTVFATMGVVLMMTFGGSGQGGNSPEAAFWAVLAFGFLFPPLFFLGLKRLFLLVFGIRTARSAWLYSLVSTILIGAVVFAPPLLIYWTITRLS